MKPRIPVAAVALSASALIALPVGVLAFGTVAAAQNPCAFPSTNPSAAAGALPLAEVARAAYGAGFRGGDLVIAVALVPPESGGVPLVRNGVGASGLWQVLESAHPDLFARFDWRDPAGNAAMAFAVFSRSGGFSPWVTFRDGAYLAHVADAQAAVAAAGLPADAAAAASPGGSASSAAAFAGGGASGGGCAPGSIRPVSGPYLGGPTGCVIADPTGTGGCIAGSTEHALGAVVGAFGDAWPVSCWDEHAWNPSSDHPLGLGCDFTVGAIGRRPSPEERARGWVLAEWLVANRAPLAVSYVIWDGQFNSGSGWRPYGGGGVYNPGDVTGGHFDHVHLSVHDRSGTAA